VLCDNIREILHSEVLDVQHRLLKEIWLIKIFYVLYMLATLGYWKQFYEVADNVLQCF